jgi:hypothetical protein
MSKSSVTVELQPEQQKVLEQWVRAHGTPQQVAMRCRIVLMSHQGYNDLEIAGRSLGGSRRTWAQAGVWPGRAHHQGDPGDQAGGADALERSRHGEGAGSRPQHSGTNLAG